MMLGSLGHTVEVMVVHPLAVMMLPSRDDIAHIAALHGVVAILVHQAVGLVEVSLIIAHRRRGLMVHHQSYTLGVSIVVECLDIKVGIGCREVKHIILAVSEPVFPSDIPSLNQHL